VVAVQVVDSADFACHARPHFHVELLDAATGEPKVALTGWSNVWGELADGAIVVSNQTAPTATRLEVAVVERTGAVRFTCSVAFDPRAYHVDWWQSARGFEGAGFKVQAPSGIKQPLDPDGATSPLFALTLRPRACALVKKTVPEQGPQALVPGPKLEAAGFETKPAGEFIELVAPNWRRKIDFAPVSCLLP
jgi:hypothetical protein